MEMDNSCELIFNIYPNNKTYLQRREIIAEKIRTIGDVGGRKKGRTGMVENRINNESILRET